MNPSALSRWAGSKVMTRLMGYGATQRKRARAERKRAKAGAPHRVEYFHQLDDGYSHLAAQLLRPLLDQYDVELGCHLVTAEGGRNLPEPVLLLQLSRLDAAAVAPHYGLHFPEDCPEPDPEQVGTATQILAAADSERFPDLAVAVGNALFSGDADALAKLEERQGSVDAATTEALCEEGNALREKLGHYSGGMFHYAGEWFWGADRFYHLENCLSANGARKQGDGALVCPRPEIETGPLRDDGSLTLEIYPSLRSPYTSVIFDLAVSLAEQTGINLVTRPVLPMVMRGVPATRQKGVYIFSDAAREAAALGLDWGRIYDPIGQPVRNAYSLYPWACKHGKGDELLSSFMRSAFFEGVSTNSDAGMRRVVERIGLSFDEARAIIGNDEWEDEIEANRQAMYGFGAWGVPSFRLLDASGNQVLALWGQDRLWLFSREIQRLLREARS